MPHENAGQQFRRVEGQGTVRITDPATNVLSTDRHAGGADIVPIKFTGAGDALAGTKISDNGSQNRIFDCRVYLMFWGSAWDQIQPPNPDLTNVANDVAAILAGPYQHSLLEYGIGSNVAKLEAVYRMAGYPPNPFSQSDVESFVMNSLNAGVFPDPSGFYCVMMPPGVSFNGPASGAHSCVTDWGGVDRFVFIGWVQYGSRNSISIIFSHELVEAITDPNGDGIQVNPRNGSSWNEIGDACSSSRSVNGVAVQSYWSAADQACVIPQNVPVTKRITCIRKVPRDDTHHAIQEVGGFVIESRELFWISQGECISEIDRGNRFFVIGQDGSIANVQVLVHFPPWQPQGSRYIATVPDNSRADNLLSLPECGPTGP